MDHIRTMGEDTGWGAKTRMRRFRIGAQSLEYIVCIALEWVGVQFDLMARGTVRPQGHVEIPKMEQTAGTSYFGPKTYR